ncbi:hypothetical protein [Paenibacillus nasutitermitis]|uniref:Uncharacterized protein n=1 Tax=Paenibacillus nasutitermitis TaxID=1652958 RepID=A0A916ZAM3_9BACL|nr:hypothetical protein [Paenibacillus nasutitermitis]GGD84651.1 hypothetical protein GCM10010911_48760 [Paenibacillus nasutitermitis]
MSNLRQQILILHSFLPDLESEIVAWALYDAALPEDQQQMNTGDQNQPPYRSVLGAMRDGWFVIQTAALPVYLRGQEHESGHLPYEYVLERRVSVS